jgi:ABC-type glutathione transport system ATPase component
VQQPAACRVADLVVSAKNEHSLRNGEFLSRVARLTVVTEKLTKAYGRLFALRECSLAVQGGEVFGLLGPNGAGKTTLIRLLLGYLRPTAGRATVAGLDCVRQSVAVRRRVAYLPAEASLFPHMRGRDAPAVFADPGRQRPWRPCARRAVNRPEPRQSHVHRHETKVCWPRLAAPLP